MSILTVTKLVLYRVEMVRTLMVEMAIVGEEDLDLPMLVERMGQMENVQVGAMGHGRTFQHITLTISN